MDTLVTRAKGCTVTRSTSTWYAVRSGSTSLVKITHLAAIHICSLFVELLLQPLSSQDLAFLATALAAAWTSSSSTASLAINTESSSEDLTAAGSSEI